MEIKKETAKITNSRERTIGFLYVCIIFGLTTALCGYILFFTNNHYQALEGKRAILEQIQRLAVFHSTVKGIYSEADGYANLSSITGYFTGPYATRFMYGTYITGDTGVAQVRFDGLHTGTFRYKIYTNGNIVITRR